MNKYCVVFMLLNISVLTTAEKITESSIRTACEAEFVPVETSESLQQYLITHAIAPEYRCVIKCMHERMHLINSEGEFTPGEWSDFIVDNFDDVHPDIKARDVFVAKLKGCGFEDVVDRCERSLRIQSCVYSAMTGRKH